MDDHQKKNVLILCTGNSCRSQMAEALINNKLTNSWQAFSAGTEPAGFVHPLALKVLEEIGIRHQGRSKTITELFDQDFDLVITVCEEAAENCPSWLGQSRRAQISFPDPAKADGSQAEKLAVFRTVRDEIILKLLGYLENIESSKDHPDQGEIYG